MRSNLISLSQVRLEAASSPSVAGWTLEGTPTNVTISVAMADLSNNRGVQVDLTSTTTTPRLVSWYRTGTSYAARVRHSAIGAATAIGGPGVGLRRSSDGKMIHCHVGTYTGATWPGFYAASWTDRDTGTGRLSRVANFAFGDVWVRMRVSAADTVVVETSHDGVRWLVQTTLSVTTVIGAGGDPDQVTRCVYTGDTSSVHSCSWDREVIA